MGQIDSFGEYVRERLDEWGSEFALHRDCDYLGHQSKNMLQVLIEHKGEMPGHAQGFKPLEVNLAAQQIEDIIADIARQNPACAAVMRGRYCGSGRKGIERLETARLLAATYGGMPRLTRSAYYALIASGEACVRVSLLGEVGIAA